MHVVAGDEDSRTRLSEGQIVDEGSARRTRHSDGQATHMVTTREAAHRAPRHVLVGRILLRLVVHWCWVRHHQYARLQDWGGGLRHPRVALLCRRVRSLERFPQVRLSPEGVLGLHLTRGALLLLSASGLLSVLVEASVTQGPLTVLDHHVAQWLHAQATPPVTTAMRAMSALGASPMVAGLALGTALHLAWRRA